MATDDTLKITHTSTTHPGAWIAFTWSWEDGACRRALVRSWPRRLGRRRAGAGHAGHGRS